MRPVPVFASLTLVAILAFAPLTARADEIKPPTLSLSGTGTVSGNPDMAVITIGTVSEAEDAVTALEKNTASTTGFINALKSAGIAAQDLQTSNFSVEPKFVYPTSKSGSQPNTPNIVGYTVRNMVTVRVRDLKLIGSVLNEAVTLGANSISGPQFSVDDPSALEAEARRMAMADAIAKAEDYAGAAGISLGAIRQITEQGSFQPRPEAIMMSRKSADSAMVPVEAGEVSYSATVAVEWALQQ
uniref:SIMPL domain-containing protein n=1 Tax=Pararhizobium sp. IMCC3301 TaxID=3067904 RepID=UPI00274121B4|nr:SIMPL domain-containing protein [Pararhizobium sp. IMCC3301]